MCTRKTPKLGIQSVCVFGQVPCHCLIALVSSSDCTFPIKSCKRTWIDDCGSTSSGGGGAALLARATTYSRCCLGADRARDFFAPERLARTYELVPAVAAQSQVIVALCLVPSTALPDVTKRSLLAFFRGEFGRGATVVRHQQPRMQLGRGV